MRRRKRQDEGDEEGKRALNEDDGPETLINKHNAIRVSFLVIPILFILWGTTCTSLEKDAGEEMMGLNDFTETDLGKIGTPSTSSAGCETLKNLGITSDHLLWLSLFCLAIWCFCPFCSLKTRAGSTLNFDTPSTNIDELELGSIPSTTTDPQQNKEKK
mgnify:FL=1